MSFGFFKHIFTWEHQSTHFSIAAVGVQDHFVDLHAVPHLGWRHDEEIYNDTMTQTTRITWIPVSNASGTRSKTSRRNTGTSLTYHAPERELDK